MSWRKKKITFQPEVVIIYDFFSLTCQQKNQFEQR